MPAPDDKRPQAAGPPQEAEQAEDARSQAAEQAKDGRSQAAEQAKDGRSQPQDGRPQAAAPGREQDGDLEGMFYQPSTNQRRHEPMPASDYDERSQEAVRQNEAYAHGNAGRESREGQGEVPGDLTPGPEDPATPPTHATGGKAGDGRPARVNRVSRAVRGRPDGEVDTQS